MADGRFAAQGPVEDVFRLRDVLRRAHLRVPALVELGIAVQDANPDCAGAPLPRTREELALLIREINKGEPAWQTKR